MPSKPGTKFYVKDKTKKEHHHDLTHSIKCPITGRRLIERVNEHSEKNINSHMFNHSIKANHPTVTLDNFKISAVLTATGNLIGKYQNPYLSNITDVR